MSMTDWVRSVAANLEPGAGGIWYSKTRSQVSYPKEGNENCLVLEADSFWFEHRNRCIQTVVQRYPPPGSPAGRLLDVGGGNGYVAAGLQANQIPVGLVEPGEQGARMARQRGVDLVICAALEDCSFRSASIPAVGIFDVLEHMPDDIAFLQEIRGLLVPGGRLYLTVPAYPLLWSADDSYSGHYRRYTLSALKRGLVKAGLQVDFLSYFFFMLPLPIFLARAIPTRLGWRKENDWQSYQKEHRARSGWVGKILDGMLRGEKNCLQRGLSIPFGASCLAVARK